MIVPSSAWKEYLVFPIPSTVRPATIPFNLCRRNWARREKEVQVIVGYPDTGIRINNEISFVWGKRDWARCITEVRSYLLTHLCCVLSRGIILRSVVNTLQSNMLFGGSRRYLIRWVRHKRGTMKEAYIVVLRSII
jgi:hypothetical protein